MTLVRKRRSSQINAWTVSQLGDFYVTNQHSLQAHAFRLLKDPARAEEVVQDVFIKVLLAAPELSSNEHALSYMHRAIENSCRDIFRAENRRPNLFALDEKSIEIEALWQVPGDHSDALVSAEDAVVVRKALALLSPSERAALVLWEVEGRSTSEIAQELGVKESTVRHTVARARKSLRRILSELIIDESRNLTAMDLLSNSYKKASVLIKDSSNVAMSIFIVLFFVFGFTSMQIGDFLVRDSAMEFKRNSELANTRTIANQQLNSKISTSEEDVGSDKVTDSKVASAGNLQVSDLDFLGLDKRGVPIGFTVSDSSGFLGDAYFVEKSVTSEGAAFASKQIIKTEEAAAKIFISQTLTFNEEKPSFLPVVSFGRDGAWVPLVVKVGELEVTRQSNGNYLLTVRIAVESEIEPIIKIEASAGGRDLEKAPQEVVTRILLNPSKTMILAQAIQVVEEGVQA